MSSAADARPHTRSLIDGIDPTSVPTDYRVRGLERLSDRQLTDQVAAVLSRPKIAAADSFILHAPLELLARTALLSAVDPTARDAARHRLVWLAATYDAAGEPLRHIPIEDHGDPIRAALALTAAVDAGDLDGVDGPATWLGTHVDPAELTALLADEVLPRLSGAAHGNIFLYLLPRVSPRSPFAATMLRGLARELARYPEWRLTWQADRLATGSAPTSTLTETLATAPRIDDPGSHFIHPMMSQVERLGTAAELVGAHLRPGVDLRQASRELLRVAALSMLQDDPDAAPYGWSHCLTLPQSAIGIAPHSRDPVAAVAIAGTYVAGFRTIQGTVRLDPSEPLERPDVADLDSAIDAGPAAAAAWMRLAGADERPAALTVLATRAAIHPDAHLAKYTLACSDAARFDPAHASLYDAAAAYLVAWWARVAIDDPLMG